MSKENHIIDKKNLSGKPFFSFGKVELNDVVCLHQSISRFHFLIHVDKNCDIYITDLGSKAGSFREKGQDYNYFEKDELSEEEQNEQPEQPVIKPKENHQEKKDKVMLEKLKSLPLDKNLMEKLTKSEKLKLGEALRKNIIDVEKINILSSVGSFDMIRDTLENVKEREVNENDVKEENFLVNEILDSEKLKPLVPVKISQGVEKIKIGMSSRNYFIVPDFTKMERYLENKERDLLVDKKMVDLKLKIDTQTDLVEDLIYKNDIKTLYVSGIDDTMNRKMIKKVFSSYGEITNIKIPVDKFGKYKGFCFLSFKYEQDLQNVLKSTGFYVDKKRLTVKIAQENKWMVMNKLEKLEKKFDDGNLNSPKKTKKIKKKKDKKKKKKDKKKKHLQ